MNNAYFILSNDDLLKEITKWHILQYLQFPNIFLEKLCDDKNIDKIKWLFLEGFITIESLNKCVQDTFVHVNDYGVNNDNDMGISLLMVEMKTFIDYILFYKKCPKVLMYIIDNFKSERDNFIMSESFKINDFQQYLKTYFNNDELIYMEKYFKLTYVKTQKYDDLKRDVGIDVRIVDGKELGVDACLFNGKEISPLEMTEIIRGIYDFERSNNVHRILCDNKPINGNLSDYKSSGINNNDNFSISNTNQLSSLTNYDKINNLGNFINLMPRKISLPINHFGDFLPRNYPNIFTNTLADDYEGPPSPTFDLDEYPIAKINDDDFIYGEQYFDGNNIEHPNTKTINDDEYFDDFSYDEQDFILNNGEQDFILNDDHVFNIQDFVLNDDHVFNKFNLGVTPSPRNTFVN